MNRYIRRTSSSIVADDEFEDEDSSVERKALIEEEELCDDEVSLFSANPFGMRNRQANSRGKNSSANNGEDHELRGINRNNRMRDYVSDPISEFTYYQIQPGDSLQSICLRYACSINQVKRLNGMITDQDFYGLRQIKLPLGKLGLLEDILKAQTSNSSQAPRIVNSPGSALSVSTRHNPQFKPLLSPGFSSDRINEMHKKPSNDGGQMANTSGLKVQHNHSHSFSSLRDFSDNNINIDIGSHQLDNNNLVHTGQLKSQNFIRPELQDGLDVDDLLTGDGVNNVGRVFQDLDYHVERAKAAAETYDQRVADLVDRIDINGSPSQAVYRRQKVSKIPELFFCNENFGLNYKKLLVFIFIVCLVVPLVYINQTNVVTTQL